MGQPAFALISYRGAPSVKTIRTNINHGCAARLSSRYPPVPINSACCGLLSASSVTISIPLRAPVAPGVNVTEMEHFDLAANDEPHVSLLTLKSPALVPPNVIPTILRVTA